MSNQTEETMNVVFVKNECVLPLRGISCTLITMVFWHVTYVPSFLLSKKMDEVQRLENELDGKDNYGHNIRFYDQHRKYKERMREITF